MSATAFAQKKRNTVAQPAPIFTATHDSLLKLMMVWVNDSDVFHRMEANGNFVKLLSRTLKQEQGFQFNLDTLKNVSCISDPENTFRIITWMFWDTKVAIAISGASNSKKTIVSFHFQIAPNTFRFQKIPC